jgi:hypothetical protein
MPIFYHDVPQYSEEYDRLKLGIPTSSHFHKIITPQGKPSKQWREYACVPIAERLLQRKIEFYNSPAMDRGLIVEAEAADWYEFDQDVTVQRVGFITDENHAVGCSPDRLVGDEGLLEIKAPLPHTQVEYWISGKLNDVEGSAPSKSGHCPVTEQAEFFARLHPQDREPICPVLSRMVLHWWSTCRFRRGHALGDNRGMMRGETPTTHDRLSGPRYPGPGDWTNGEI